LVGTVFENSKLEFRRWYWAAFLMICSKACFCKNRKATKTSEKEKHLRRKNGSDKKHVRIEIKHTEVTESC
jgi:hypothetical protein